jgi:molybdenum cofactor cytidylyltransferase
MHIDLLILAAGASTRMGRIKQLLPWGNTSLLGHAIKQGLDSKASTVNVVLGANSNEILANEIFSDVNVILNEAWEKGLGHSIALGIDKLSVKHSSDAIIIMLADQPFVDAAYINQLILKYQENTHGVVATSYKNKPGVPALFAEKHFDSLRKLEGDYGAKKLMIEMSYDLITIDGSSVILDLDTMKEYLSSKIQ